MVGCTVGAGVGVDPACAQLFARLYALTVPIPVAKSQPTVAPYAGEYELFEVDSTPFGLAAS
jgi:hypothetical protein